MKAKYTAGVLRGLERRLRDLSYTPRYESGNFEGGCCVVNRKKMVVLSKFLSLESKIDFLHMVLAELSTPQVKPPATRAGRALL